MQGCNSVFQCNTAHSNPTRLFASNIGGEKASQNIRSVQTALTDARIIVTSCTPWKPSRSDFPLNHGDQLVRKSCEYSWIPIWFEVIAGCCSNGRTCGVIQWSRGCAGLGPLPRCASCQSNQTNWIIMWLNFWFWIFVFTISTLVLEDSRICCDVDAGDRIFQDDALSKLPQLLHFSIPLFLCSKHVSVLNWEDLEENVITSEPSKVAVVTSIWDAKSYNVMNFFDVLWTAEHMLFYASEKYPEEGSYKKFLSEVWSIRTIFPFHLDVKDLWSSPRLVNIGDLNLSESALVRE